MADFLLEIGTEEIPAGMISGLAEDLARAVTEGLRSSGLEAARSRNFGAPRRIGLLLEGLPERQEDREETVAGPPLSAARDASGSWTKAAEGFARKQGVAMGDLREVAGLKGPCVGFARHIPGRSAAEVLAEIVPRAVDGLHLPKAMRWGEGTEVFVRPVRWVVALLDDEVVRLTIKGIEAGRTSRGHRVHGEAEVEIGRARRYFDILRDVFVVADPEERVRKLEGELRAAAEGLQGSLVPDPDLVAKMAFLCEFPSVLSGRIAEEFLTLPTEVLVACLREHQNFFVVRDARGEALPHFLAVMDAPSDPKGFIRTGLENVSRSRLSDARFFYDHDVRVPLEDRLEALRGVVFHPKLGTYHDKALRTEALCLVLAKVIGADASEAGWAGRHAKCDLVSLLVQEKEFTALQGVAGGLFAKAQGRPEGVWQAVYDHYRPLSSEDELPRGAVGAAVALADKLDTLREMFRIGQAPTGSKDPFALRRGAVGVMRILCEHPQVIPFDLIALLDSTGPVPEGLVEFLEGRLRFLWEAKGYPYDEINSVLEFGVAQGAPPHLLGLKIRDLHTVREQFAEDFDHLAVAFKRAKNILKGTPEADLDPSLFLPPEEKEGAGERALHEAVEAVRQEAEDRFEKGQYAEGLKRLATVRPAVDRFFEDVLVMCDPEGKDPARTALQNNRLALLRGLVALFDRVADFSQIVPRETR